MLLKACTVYLVLRHIVGASLIGQPGIQDVVVCGRWVATLATVRAVAGDAVDQNLRRQLHHD